MVGQGVSAASGASNGDLAIELGDVRFTIHDSSAHHESYQVRHGDDLIVV